MSDQLLSVHDVALIDLLAPHEITAAFVQEHLDDVAEACPPEAGLPWALVEVISRMTNAGMEADEIARRLAGVTWGSGATIGSTTVQHARQILAGTKTSEGRARRITRERSGGKCELGQHARAVEVAHRISRGRQGAWHAANLLDLCSWHHSWSHGHLEASYAAGWMVKTGYEPARVPVWLDCAYGPGWYLLDDEGGYQLVDLVRGPVEIPMPEPVLPRPRTWKAEGAHR